MIRDFGQFQGETIREITLRSDAGAEARVITWGAVVRDLTVPLRDGTSRHVVLGFEQFDDYPAHSPYFGAIAGRYANRIGAGRFTLDDTPHQVALNQKDASGRPMHHLHGGFAGFGKRPWHLVASGRTFATLALISPDGDEGYPGTLAALCTYRLLEPATLQVELTATTDRPTIVNLAHHSYFNLDGSSDVGDHLMTLDADFYTPVGDGLIPTGEILSVAGTPFDFRSERPIGQTVAGVRFPLDHNFVLRQRDGFARAARVRSPQNGLALEVWTTEPGVQFYEGAKLNPPVPGLGGVRYGASSGFCLEPQRFPDSPNHAHFTDPTLRPGAVYRQTTEYRFA